MHCFSAGSIRLHLLGTLEGRKRSVFPPEGSSFLQLPPASACRTESELVDKLCRAVSQPTVSCKRRKIFQLPVTLHVNGGQVGTTWQRNNDVMITV